MDKTTAGPSSATSVVRFAGPEDAEMIVRFNARLSAGGIDYRYRMSTHCALAGEHHRPPGYPVYGQLLVLESDGEIRAGILLQHGRFWVDGEEKSFCWWQLP